MLFAKVDENEMGVMNRMLNDFCRVEYEFGYYINELPRIYCNECVINLLVRGQCRFLLRVVLC